VKESIVEGRFLTKDDVNGAVIAAGLQRGIGAKIGEHVIIVANTKDGYQNAIELDVIGIIEEKAAQANSRLVYIPLGRAQELLFMEDEVTEIVIKTDKEADLDELKTRLNYILKEKNLESNTWKDVSAFFVDIMKKQNAVVFVICLVFYLIVVSSITNTMILTLFERKKEIGTMMAIGIKGAHVMRLIVIESTILGFIGSMIGILISVLIISVLNVWGVTYKPPNTSQYVTIYPIIDVSFMLLSFLLGLISAVVASIYPARKVLQVNPVDALRSL
jgi:putative ABC transport system permease protein